MQLTEAFQIKPGQIVSFVGAGGKSTAMWSVAAELKDAGEKVVVTTTTKIFGPKEDQADQVLLGTNCLQLTKILSELPERKIIALGAVKKNDKLHGLLPEVVCRLKKQKEMTILVEADGSAGKPFKAPAHYELRVPCCTDVVITVVGMDILGKTLTGKNTHRLEEVTKITGLSAGELIGPEAIAQVLLSPHGYCRQELIPAGSQWIVVLNKLDKCRDEENLQKLVETLLDSEEAPARVVGTIFTEQPQKIIIWDKIN